MYEDLAGVAELAKMLEVGRTTVTQWAARRHRSGFPSPVLTLAMGPIYSRAAVRDWHNAYTPEKGVKAGRTEVQGG